MSNRKDREPRGETGHVAFRERERKAKVLEELADQYAKVTRYYNDGRPALAVDLCVAICEATDTLGDEFTTTQFPICLPCGGTAEMVSLSESDRKMRCQDQPSVCKGNGFGRMHPVQLKGFIEDAAIPKVPPIHDSVGSPEVDPDTGEMKPTAILGGQPYDKGADHEGP